jgi:hypothetical protein
MASKSRLTPVDVQNQPRPFCGPACTCLADFFREEFLKHHQCLERQREYYSERVICDVEAALQRILKQLDRLCAQQDAEQVVSKLLHKIDVLTGLSAWSDPKQVN